MIFGGRYGAADALLGTISQETGNPSQTDRQTPGDVHQVRAFRAMYARDSMASLEGLKAAIDAFEVTGDRRNVCMMRANLGFMLAELGDFPGAEDALRAAFSDADRMGLNDVAMTALHNLGHVLVFRRRLDEARAIEQRAAEAFRKLGDPRLLGVAQTYLAKIALLSGDPTVAEREARAASEALRVAPPLRAAAVAVLARVLLALGRPADALPVAREAFETLESLGMIEEGESLVRLVYAEALEAAGLADEFATAIAGAREHLLARAAKISDPEWRGRFLTAVPENARTLALAGELPGAAIDVEQTRP
jgi:tetratricopeptide (TPR) repeat protein